jgi:uncharacterized protein (TIGR04168 family)
MRFALIGDTHDDWSEADAAYFAAGAADMLLFTGDLAWLTGNAMFPLAARIARLPKPFAMVAGNHDCTTLLALLGEIAGQRWPATLEAGRIARRYRKLAALLGPGLVGYSALQAGAFTVVGARPFAMEGGRLSFAAPLGRLFGVKTLAESAERLVALVRETPGELVLLAHNGPAGAGSTPDAPFGVDFRQGGGDNGDTDLQAAVAAGGARVRLVVAGHMHHAVAHTARLRRYWYREGSTLFVNAARVPRHAGPAGYYLEAALAPAETRLDEVTYDLRTGAETSRRELTRFSR